MSGNVNLSENVLCWRLSNRSTMFALKSSFIVRTYIFFEDSCIDFIRLKKFWTEVHNFVCLNCIKLIEKVNYNKLKISYVA